MIKDEVLKAFFGKNILVTGGTGMIGREIAIMLANAGAHVRVVSLDRISIADTIEHVYGDLTDFNLCKNVTRDMDAVFHVAGIKGSVEVTQSKPASFFVPLLMFNTNILEASRLNKVPKLVYTSSIGAYASAEIFKESEGLDDGPPMDMYPGWAKRMAEMQIRAYAAQYGMENFSVVRPCNVYGPGDNFDPKNAMVIPTLLSRIDNKEDPVVVWGDGSAIRDFAFSRDVAEGTILALHHGTRGRYVNLGSGLGVTIRELVETLHSFLDFNYRFDTTKPAGFPRRIMDITLARQWIDYNPTTSLREGLEETWQWFLANQNEFKCKKNYFADQ
ncbi:MAG: NAD(P)-dependent oxidoreductase [Magnetococcales bacterium]|nr:NAD(P)-dependent oxidoreductase [Magnetococcales bacterium]MBF0438020.1 NAD(P)-dependent oxidoreductase [Magnetococcales bacterium]